MREGKGGALLGLAFFSQPQKAGAGDRPEGARPSKKKIVIVTKTNSFVEVIGFEVIGFENKKTNSFVIEIKKCTFAVQISICRFWNGMFN